MVALVGSLFLPMETLQLSNFGFQLFWLILAALRWYTIVLDFYPIKIWFRQVDISLFPTLRWLLWLWLILPDNRPADAFMDVAGNPIPELMENAVIEPVPNVDANTLNDLAAYRAGVLQSTDPAAEHYVTPERLEEIKKLAAQQDATNTPEGELDALNEKMKQPITQAQYEETNKKYSDAVDAVTNTLPNNDADTESIDDSFNKLDGIITDIPNASLPVLHTSNYRITPNA